MISKIFTRTVGYWPLQESSGKALDYSGNENHGSLKGGVTQDSSGPLGGTSYSFNGSDGYVSAPGLGSGFSTGFTVAYWVYPAAFQGAGNYNYHISYESGSDSNSVFRFEQDDDSNGELDFGVYKSSGSWTEISSSALNEASWNQVAGVVDASGNMELFVNNNSQGRKNTSVANDAANYVNLAARHGGQNFFNGKLAHIRVWSYPLSEAQIRALYNASLGGFSEAPSKST